MTSGQLLAFSDVFRKATTTVHFRSYSLPVSFSFFCWWHLYLFFSIPIDIDDALGSGVAQDREGMKTGQKIVFGDKLSSMILASESNYWFPTVLCLLRILPFFAPPLAIVDLGPLGVMLNDILMQWLRWESPKKFTKCFSNKGVKLEENNSVITNF